MGLRSSCASAYCEGGTIKKTKRKFGKSKKVNIVLVSLQVLWAAAAAAFTAAVKRYMEEAAAASLCASNLPEIALSVFWLMLCFDVSRTEVVPSFLHGLLRDGRVLGLRFGRASSAAAFFAALLDMLLTSSAAALQPRLLVSSH